MIDGGLNGGMGCMIDGGIHGSSEGGVSGGSNTLKPTEIPNIRIQLSNLLI